MEKDDQREGMSKTSKDMSDHTRGEDKSQMATKDQSDKTKGEMRAAKRREFDCGTCGRRTTHEFVGSRRMGERDGCDLINYRCQNCGRPGLLLRFNADSPLIIPIDPDLGPENGGGHEGGAS